MAFKISPQEAGIKASAVASSGVAFGVLAISLMGLGIAINSIIRKDLKQAKRN